MRKGKAFRFIPELLSGNPYLPEIMGNPIEFYVRDGLEVLKLASKLWTLYSTAKVRIELEKKNHELEEMTQGRVEAKNNHEFEYTFQALMNAIDENRTFKKSARAFISQFQKDLLLSIKHIQEINMKNIEIDSPIWENRMDILRRAIRDHNKIQNYIV